MKIFLLIEINMKIIDLIRKLFVEILEDIFVV